MVGEMINNLWMPLESSFSITFVQTCTILLDYCKAAEVESFQAPVFLLFSPSLMLSPDKSYRHTILITSLETLHCWPKWMALGAVVFKGLIMWPKLIFQTFLPFSVHVLYDSVNWTVCHSANISHTLASLSLGCDLSPMMTIVLIYSGCYNKNTIG